MGKKKSRLYEDEKKHPEITRARKLAFLFRRKVAAVLRRDGELLLASSISAVIRGSPGSDELLEALIFHFHTDADERRSAAERMLARTEFQCESEAKKADFEGDAEAAASFRRLIMTQRAWLEKKVGPLPRHGTIEKE